MKYKWLGKVRLGGKSWLKKGVSDLQGQANAWVSSWRQDTCVAWHKPLFNLTSRPPVMYYKIRVTGA